jgi:hypothetical protein
MGLDSFISEPDKEDKTSYHDNPTLDKEKLHNPDLCPSCGKEGEHLRGIEYKCVAHHTECSVITYYTTNK